VKEDGEQNVVPCKNEQSSHSMLLPASTVPSLPSSSCLTPRRFTVNVKNVTDVDIIMNLKQWRSKIRTSPVNPQCTAVNVQHVREKGKISHWKKNLVHNYLSLKKHKLQDISKKLVKKVKKTSSISDSAYRILIKKMRELYPDTVSEVMTLKKRRKLIEIDMFL
jgi:hypothetical protein